MDYVVFGGCYPMYASIISFAKNPLERAILEKNWPRLRVLLQNTRIVNEPTSDGSLPLIFFLRHSVGARVGEIVKLFLSHFSEIENVYVDDSGIHRESALIEII